VRLDHLLSKEHHEKHPDWWGVGRVGVVRCSGGDRVRNNECPVPLGGGSKAAGTLLGPETTPRCRWPVWLVIGVLSLHLVVGCGV
jgi:hypothetical protein